jgi:membrane protease YdiL (CAAX protease family)
MEPTAVNHPKTTLCVTIIYLAALFAAWIGALQLLPYLMRHSILPHTELARFIYWTVVRILVWLLPSCYLIRRSGRKLSEVLSLKDFKRILLWGGGYGLLAALSNVVTGKPLFSLYWNVSVLTAVIIGPIVEEIAFRGVVLDALQSRMKFWLANFITGILFMLVHFPGWYVHGTLTAHISTLTGGALTICVLGWILGFIAKKSRSVSGSILAHMLNNFFSLF